MHLPFCIRRFRKACVAADRAGVSHRTRSIVDGIKALRSSLPADFGFAEVQRLSMAHG
jgi:hypothetical protein